MNEDADVDAIFHIPVSSVVKAAVKEAEQKKQPAAPVVIANPNTTTQNIQDSSVRVQNIQPAPISSFVPVQYAVKATYNDKMLYNELSAVSDEVLACRNRVLNSI